MKLNLKVYSFGYKFSGVPENEDGDKGGFVFDCRCLPNPYKVESLRKYCGKDLRIIEYFADKKDVHRYIDYCVSLVKLAAENYIERKFENMQICFGCTGGYHRSVYCCEKFVEIMRQSGFSVDLKHVDLPEALR